MNACIEKMERSIEAISTQNASLSLTLNKLMMVNLKLKAGIKNPEEKRMLLELTRAGKNCTIEQSRSRHSGAV